MSRIALVTCRVLPEPDPDQDLLVSALGRAGMDASLVSWDDPAADPAAFDACILRSTWNYYEDPGAFLRWVDGAAAVSRVLNPADVVRWNLHKRYLSELERAGVPIIPTEWFERGAGADLAAVMDARGWDDVVVKPSVSAGSFGTRRFRAVECDEGQRFLDALLAKRDAMVQRYMPGVEAPGERAVVWIDGDIQHAVTKEPRFSGAEERVSDAVPVSKRERDVAGAALACIDQKLAQGLLYARIDLVADDDGAPVVSELELIEPSLFLLQHPPAVERFVAAIARAAEGT